MVVSSDVSYDSGVHTKNEINSENGSNDGFSITLETMYEHDTDSITSDMDHENSNDSSAASNTPDDSVPRSIVIESTNNNKSEADTTAHVNIRLLSKVL